jgi:hypothetical protein
MDRKFASIVAKSNLAELDDARRVVTVIKLKRTVTIRAVTLNAEFVPR